MAPNSRFPRLASLAAVTAIVVAAAFSPLAQVSAPVIAQERPGPEGFDRKAWLAVAPGRVEPWSGEIKISAPLAARIADVGVGSNDTVFAGEAMLRLDDDEVRSRHAKAELNYYLRKRARPKTADGRAAADRRKYEDAAFDAERALIDARAAVDRAALAKRKGGSADALDPARKALDTARQQFEQRRAELAKFEADNPNVDTDEGVAMARLELRAADAALDNLVVRAPLDATVLQVNVRPGEFAAPTAQQPLFVLGDVSKLRVRAELDERDYGSIAVGHKVVVRSTAFRGQDIAGTVSSIAPLIEAGRISARGQRSMTDVSVAEIVIDLAERGPLVVGMRVDVFFSRESANR